MSDILQRVVKEAAARCGGDRSRAIDLLREVQARLGCVSAEAIALIAAELATPRVEIEGLVRFYAFLSMRQLGRTVIRLSDCPACRGAEGGATAAALRRALGIGLGETTPDGRFTLARTACVGLCDQGPAALVDDRLVAGLRPERVKALLDAVAAGTLSSAGFDPADHLRQPGELLGPFEPGAALRRAVSLGPRAVLEEVKAAKLRGRGGAGFPTGSKWEYARAAAGDRKFVFCNADEGEPGAFKDRVLLSRVPELAFEGMAIGGYTIGAAEGIFYLRAEYQLLRPRLEQALDAMRRAGLLGRGLAGKAGFDFDIRIQMGAGAYVCGEESALIASCEGRRGVPRNRPPFPVEKGYLGCPTTVNNVETFCCAARILERGAPRFAATGTRESAGTKLFSVSGDCARPGVWELPFGVTLRELLARAGGEGAQAVLVGGPSGSFVAPAGFDRRLAFEDLPTGGSIMVFGPERDLLEVVSEFMQFFIEESCGWCTPCRVGNVLLKERLDRVRAGLGLPEDLAYLDALCTTVKKTSRCGLGQSSPNPIQSTLAAFRGLYEARVKARPDGLQPAFDLDAALAGAARAQGPTVRGE